MKGYNKLWKKAMKLLETELPDHLTYHGIEHTLKSLKVSEEYIEYEKIDKYEAQLLRLGVLLHDIGFIVSEIEHEKEGVKIARQLMKDYGFSEAEFIVVKGIIMATKLPQNPKNNLEKIMADIDLDYLGRNDYYQVSDLLFQELKNTSSLYSRMKWIEMQIEFLEEHRYFSDFAKKNRKPNKEKRIKELKEVLKKKNADNQKL